MSGAKKLRILAGALVVLVLLGSCTNFFSKTWGDLFKRNPKNVKVTSSNVYDLLDAARGDPELSRAILDQINANSSDYLKIAAIKAANQGAGVSTLVFENVRTLVDAVENKNYEEALQKVAESILAAAASNKLEHISDKMAEILADKYLPSPKTALSDLANAKKIEVAIPAEGGKDATVSISVDNKGMSTATITIGNQPTSYECEVNDNGTITLLNAGNNETNVNIGYTITRDDRIVLSGLDQIAGNELAPGASKPSEQKVPPSKPVFAEGFLDKSSVSDSDLTLMVMTLILAKAEKEKTTDPDGTLDTYIKTWLDKSVETGEGLDYEEKLIAAIVNGMVERGEDTSELTNLVKNLLGVS
jgi:hypothetical protein